MLVIITQMKYDDQAQNTANDWKFVAMVIDRLCLWMFLVMLVIGSLAFLMRAPKTVDDKDLPPLEFKVT